MKSAIIFGVNGQDGYYLNELLVRKNIKVIGISRSTGEWIKGDVGDFPFVKSVIEKYKPDYIFHFAATSSTKHSAIFENRKAVGIGTLNILESVKDYCPNCRVFLSGSALQFKNEGKPINEKTPFEATSAYAAERIYSTYLGRYYRNTFGLKVYIGYFFNHDSPKRTSDHVAQYVVEKILKIAKGSKEKIKIGDLDAKREFNFAGDMVQAVWILVNQNKIFEAVIGCGRAYKIKDFIKYCFSLIKMDWKDFVSMNKNFRPEYKILVSNPGLIKSLGWIPETRYQRLANTMMEDGK